MKLIVGLGNPGKQYAKTRHNVGFVVVDAVHEILRNSQIGNWELSKKFNAEIVGGTVGNERIILVKPMTFMNDSGIAVSLLSHFYKIPSRYLLVIHDDKDIPIGEIKVQKNRGSAGHNGVQSIIDHIGTEDFSRIRIGIRPENEKRMADVPSFVLDKFGLFEKKKIDNAIDRGVQEVLRMIKS